MLINYFYLFNIGYYMVIFMLENIKGILYKFWFKIVHLGTEILIKKAFIGKKMRFKYKIYIIILIIILF